MALKTSTAPEMRKSDWDRYFSYVEKSSGCWNWVGSVCKRGGYGQINIRSRVVKAHRLALFHATGEWSSMLCCHKCHNPQCCNPDHLYWGTHLSNSKDARQAGRSFVPTTARGEDSHLSKMTNETVLKIRSMYANGTRQAHIANQLNVSVYQVHSVVKGRSWAWMR